MLTHTSNVPESDRIKRFHTLIGPQGEGNGNPLQYSCLENPVDRGAWWAAVHGVAQSLTLLKWLSMHAAYLFHIQ